MTDVLRMPISVVARKGISALAHSAEDRRILLTSHGWTIAVVDSAERLDEDIRKVREAARLVTDNAASLLASRSTQLSLQEVCDRIGIDIAAVRDRAVQLSTL
jgi:PHD/YefM family antitoxin component YafN of YafNO toxin-antitoxin module